MVSDNKEILMAGCDSMELLIAETYEIDSWRANDVFEEVHGQQCDW